MRMPARFLTLALAASAVAAVPVAVSPDAEAHCFVALGAETADETDDVEACRQDVWFHEAGLKADNLDHAAGGAFATWDTTPPSSSVTGGAGAGALTTSALHQQADAWDPRESFVASGEFTGLIDNVVVEVYMFRPGLTPSFTTADPTGATLGGEIHSVDAVLYVNGMQVASLADVDAHLQPAGQAAERITFAFRDLAESMQLFARFGGLDLTGTNTIEVRTHGTGIASDAAVVVYDTTEVPAGLVFNAPAELLEQVD